MNGTVLRDGMPNDFAYIDGLRKREGSALGFIPKDAYISVLECRRVGNRERFRYQRLLVTTDNGDLTGFCYASYAGDTASIIQICVQQDARRWHRALMMADAIESDARSYYKNGLTCRVAYDLESNTFWRAIGYEPVKLMTSTWLNQKESKSKRPLWLYRKDFGYGLFGKLPTPSKLREVGSDSVIKNHMKALDSQL